jgi:class 3 adenylate cyclase/tetratricopeptide (TPR) repeat protein
MPICTSCGQENPEIARFCLACGSSLAVAAEPVREERKIVSVLFVDLVGFTSRAEELDPEDVDALLAPYWEHVRGELVHHGGTVEKFIGDAVMSLFGAPVAHEDDPERAVRAALAIRDWIDEQRDDLRLRIAVTTGEALVRLGARPLEGEGMASGDVVNAAARLQAAAPSNGILVDETTYRATEHAIEYRGGDAITAKGKRQPIPVWEAVEARSRFGIDVPTAYSTPLVGRRREVDDLRDAVTRAREDRTPQLVTLVGVPGIGKSRLVHELSRHVDADPDLVRWRQGRSLPYGEGASFWALGEMVKAEAGILETDSAVAAEAKLRETVDDTADEPAERGWLAARLRPLVGLPAEGVGVDDRRSEFFAAWRRFVEELAGRRPTVLVFEDLHWADDDLLDFVDHLVDWASDVPLLVVGTARPELLERRPGWGGGKRNAATISLTPLEDSETGALVAELMGESALPPELHDSLLARAGGNPLYAEQYVRMLDERGEEDLPMPETVQGLIAARLDALTVEEKALLQDAAVFGKVFWLGAVSAIGGGERAHTEQLLHLLERKEFVQRARRASVAGETEYAFRHVLVRDVAYNQIPRASRAEKHRLAAQWIAGLGRVEDHADLLAYHYVAALELARAAGADTAPLAAAARVALVEAGDRATALYAFAGAIRCFEAALDLWDPTAPDYPLVLFRLVRIQHELSRPVTELLRETLAALLAVGEIEKAAEIETRLAYAVWLSGERDEAMEHLEHATRLVHDQPPSEAKAYLLANQARFHTLASRSHESIAVGDQALAMADELGLDHLRVHTLVSVGVSAISTGQAERGIAMLKEGIALSDQLNGVEGLRGHANLASCLWSLGDWKGAREHRERGLQRAQQFGAVWSTIFLTAEIALDHYRAGEWDLALEAAHKTIEATATTPHLMETAARAARALIACARDDVDSAVRDFERVLEIGRTSKDPQTLFPALAGFAELLLEGGRPRRGEELADELLELTPIFAGEFFVNEWAVSLALVLRALGRSGELDEVVASARLHTRWRDAVAAIEGGELVEAAAALHDVGDLPHEALVRLRGAEALAAAGRRSEADDQLERALAFYRSVDATRYIAQAEALAAATA